MMFLCKLILNGSVFPKFGRHYAITSQRHLQYSYLITGIRVLERTYTIPRVRYQTTNAFKEKISVLDPARKGKKQSELRNLFALAIPQKWKLLSAVTFLIISSSVTMMVPFCLGKGIDAISSLDKDRIKMKLKDFSIILLGIFIIGGVSNFCRIYLMSTAGHSITQALRKSAYNAILRQETAMFDKRSTGELVGRLTGDAQLISSAVTSNVSDGLRSAITSIIGVSMMLYVSPKLTLVGLSIIPPVAAMAIVYGRFLKKISTAVQDSVAVLNTMAEERISNIRTVKAFAQENREVEKYSLKLQNTLRLCYKESFYRGIFFGLTGLSGNIIIFAVLYYGGVMVSESAITIGSLSAFLLYAAYVGIAMNGLSSFYSELNKALGANARIFELIQRQPAIPNESGQILDKELSGNIKFENVSFIYPTRKGTLVLKNINLYIPKCTVTAIVGSSGSGKSTVASLLLRLYDPTEGCILLDDHNLKCLNPKWVKSQISIVSQEPTLFSGTIKENITYGVEDATEFAVEEAARQAHVLEFTQRMAEGLNTIVGERGVTLSGGQRQRIAIARALIKKPKILILDEATSALDAQSENLVQKALEKVVHGRTVLIIAHRLSTIKNASKVVVLNCGEIQEIGTFNELMSLENSYFRQLVKHQAFT